MKDTRTNMRTKEDMEQEIECLRENLRRLQRIVDRRNVFVKRVTALGNEELQAMVDELQQEEDYEE